MNYFNLCDQKIKQQNYWYKYLLFDEEKKTLTSVVKLISDLSPHPHPFPSCFLPVTAWSPHTQPHFS